jgi:hypothetical protein
MRSLVVLVRPEAFFVNPETCKDNYFQAESAAATSDEGAEVRAKGLEELAGLQRALEARGVVVRCVPLSAVEGGDVKPDAIFPNNSFSLHAGPRDESTGTRKVLSVLWPMSPGRVDEIPSALRVALGRACGAVHDLRHMQEMPGFGGTGDAIPFVALEGTGALVFSHDADACFVARSQRASDAVLRLATSLPGLTPFQPAQLRQVHSFTGVDAQGRDVYHTNVLGWCGVRAAGWCLAALKFQDESRDDLAGKGEAAWGADSAVRFLSSRRAFVEYFAAKGVALIDLTPAEMASFAGNCLELFDAEGKPFLTMSATARANLSPQTAKALGEVYGPNGIQVVDVPYVERFGGGSVRCLQAHLNFDSDLAASVDELVGALDTALQAK